MVAAIDDNPNIRLMRLFNEDAGKAYLINELGIDAGLVEKLSLLGISSIANLMGSIKLAKYYEMDENDVVFSVATDSMEMYQSRLSEENQLHGEFTNRDAAISFDADILGLNIDHMIEMNYYEKKRIAQSQIFYMD